MNMGDTMNDIKKHSEWSSLLLLLFVILPLGMIACIGIYGFVIWFLQLYVIGLPTA
ncbi:nitrate/trimethylamine N-oxide reductase NapE/TorE [Aggregatibacter aphrophilus NJ8700]|nr:nitrate/trimethylamine N-oxide reductase NapE/TorE [Aggregatibacter aphrophilus NJ8700]KNE86182.1 nitrate/trimethylamine N-oxide reductase NapE/TorE [Aggregatibacter aphrophilus ATCC 33389]